MAYGVALISVAAALFIRRLLDPFLEHNFQLVTLFGAVAVTVCYGGWRPALLAALVGYVAVDYLFIPPRYASNFLTAWLAALAGYSLSCAVIIYMGERLLRARQRVQSETAERFRAEQATAEREHRLRLVTDATPALISYIDRDQRYRFVNREYEHWFGFPPGEVIGKTMAEVLGHAAMERLRPHVEQVLRGQDVRFEVEAPYRAGGTRWIDAHYVADRSVSGEIAGFFVLVVDITKRKRTEQALAEAVRRQQVLYRFLERRHETTSLPEVFEAALDAILAALRCDRASILLHDDAQIMRFVAWRGLSNGYRKAVDGRSPWGPSDPNPQVVCVDDISVADIDDAVKEIVIGEGIRALVFIPVVLNGKLIGKFMTYYNEPHPLQQEEIDLGLTIARQIALAVSRSRSVEALRESEESYRAVVENQTEMVCRFRPDGTIIFVNSAYAMARGTTAEALTGANFWAFIEPQDRPNVRAMLDRLTPESPEARTENRFETTQGVRWTLWTNRAVTFDAEGRWLLAQSTGIDITDRKRAEQALQESEQRLRLATSAGNVGVWDWDIVSNVVTWSDTLYAIHGIEPGKFGGSVESFAKLIHPEDLERVNQALRRTLEEDAPYDLEFRVLRPDGRITWVYTHANLLRDAAATPVRLLGGTVDITLRKEAELELRERQERYELVVAGAESAIWDWDVVSKRVIFSPRWKALRGLSGEEVSDSEDEWLSRIHPDDLERVTAAVQAHFDGRTPVFAEEYRVRHKDGRWIWILDRGIARRDETGRVVRMAGSETDITERRRAEEALRQSEERFRSIFEGVGISIWEEDFTQVKAEIDALADSGVSDFRRYFAEHPEFVERAIRLVRIRDVNPATVRMFRASDRTELLHSLEKIFVPESVTVFTEQLVTIALRRRLLETETVVQTLTGERVNVLFTVAFPPHDQPFDRVLVTVSDITERKRAEDVLRQSEERFRLLANNSQILIWMTDPQGKLRFVNRAFRDFFAIGRDQADQFDWIEIIHADDRGPYVDAFMAALRGRKRFHGRARVRRFDGEWRWVESRGAAISDAGGMDSYIGSSVDITDIYESEQKLKELDQRKDEFLANMSHEIRSPLTGIMGYADVLMSRLKDPLDLEYLRTIKESGDYLIEIVNDILDLAKIEAGKLVLNIEPVPLHSILTEVQTLMDVRARQKKLPLSLRYEGSLPPAIKTDRTRLRQILINLVSNAIKFTESGRVEIVVRSVPAEELLFERGPQPLQTASYQGAPSPALRFEVIDTGIGIAPEHQEVLFQPFSQADTTSTRPYDGTGLGLTITRRLVQMLGGKITFESELGKGSTFRVTVPVGSGDRSSLNLASPVAVDEVSRPLRDLRVLTVDDREEFCYLVSRYIEDAGGRTEAATDGETAIRAVETAAATDPFDAVILDIQMPGMDGYEVARTLRAKGVKTPIIALTAGAMVGDREKCLAAGCDDYLTKPIDRYKLVQLVAQHAQCSRHAGSEEIAELKVLLVDDSHNACKLLSRFLEKRGHEVRTAHDGESALALAQEFRPELVMLDIRLPDMNGYELMRRLKRLNGIAGATFIGISGYDFPSGDYAMAFDHFLAKPIDITQLALLVEDVAKSAKAGGAESL